MTRRPSRLLVPLLPALAVGASVGGCAVAHLVGGMAQNQEYQKLLQVLPKYDLENKKVAVVADADLNILYEHPRLLEQITGGVTLRIGRDVPGAQVRRPDEVLAWQWRTPQWNALPYGQIAEELGVDRVVYIEIYEYRLNPPGNRWLWEGVCAASVGVIEREGFDPDMFVDTFNVVSEFPNVKNVDRAGATAEQIETGVLAQFIKRTANLFHEHLEPKYPDKYRPDAQAKK